MIKIDLNHALVQKELNKIQAKTNNLKPLFAKIGESLKYQHEIRFEKHQAPDGKAWQPLNTKTIKAKTRQKRNFGILYFEGKLKTQLFYNISDTKLKFGTSRIYAARHQFGFKNHTPKRPWLGISKDDKTKLINIISNHLTAKK